MEDESAQEAAPQDNDAGLELTAAQAGCLFVAISPVIAFVGAIRWNITHKLDADLAAIISWFCDTALLFLLLLPLSATKTKSELVNRFFKIATTKMVITVYIFYLIFIVGFVVATLIAFHYLIGVLFTALFG